MPQNVQTLVRANRSSTFDPTVELVEMVYNGLTTMDVYVDENKEKKWTAPASCPILNWLTPRTLSIRKMRDGECKWGV